MGLFQRPAPALVSRCPQRSRTIRTITSPLYSTLVVAIPELCGNASSHSGSPCGGFLTAETYRHGSYMAVGDFGIGIREHLTRNPRCQSIGTDEEAIRRAMEPGVTGTRDRRGYGFDEVLEQLEDTVEAELYVHSGKGWARTMRFVFSGLGAYFSTRERGAKVRDEINEALRRTPEDLLILDFGGVQLISFSFADEVVGRLVSDRASGGMGEVSILVVNASDEVIHPIQSSMERRKLVVACLQSGGIRLIGAPEHVAATFKAAQVREEFRTPELAADLGITVQAANNRLKPLLSCGLLIRRPGIPRVGGKEYVYRVAVPSSESLAA